MRNGLLSLILALGSSPARGQDRPDPEKLKRLETLGKQVRACFEKKEYDRAIELCKEAITLAPRMPQPYEKIAWAYALQGVTRNSLVWIRKALRVGEMAGMSLGKNFLDDPAYQGMKQNPEFEQLYQSVQQQVAQARKEVESVPDPRDEFYRPVTCKGRTNCPLLVLLDGLGGNPKTFQPHFRAFAEESGFLLLTVCGSRKLGMNDGEAAYGYDFESDPRRIAETIRKTCEKESADPRRVYLVGFSQGAILAIDIAVRNPECYAGVVAMGGGLRVCVEDHQADSAEPRCPVWLTWGKHDSEGFLLVDTAKALREAGYPVSESQFEGGHELPDPKATLPGALRWIEENRNK